MTEIIASTRIEVLTEREITAIVQLTMGLVKLRQGPVQHLCIENIGPEIFGKLVREYLQAVNLAPQ